MIGASLQDVPGGVELTAVDRNGPAGHAGLREGDRITKIDDLRVSATEELIVEIRNHRPGDKVVLEYERGNQNASCDRDARQPGGLRMTPLLLDINAPEFLLLLVLAVILFGPERLPDLARKAARVVRYVRTMAGSAQEQLSRELGPGLRGPRLPRPEP